MNPVLDLKNFSTWKPLLRKATTVDKATKILRKINTLNKQIDAKR